MKECARTIDDGDNDCAFARDNSSCVQSERSEMLEAIQLVGEMLELLKLFRNNGMEANDALWDIAEDKTNHDDPKRINQVYQDIVKKGDPVIKKVTVFMEEKGLATVKLPDLDWPVERYKRLAREHKSYIA